MHTFSQLLAGLALLPLACQAQSEDPLPTDTLSSAITSPATTLPQAEPVRPTAALKVDRLTENRWFRTLYVGAPLIIAGLVEKHEDRKFRTLRNDFLPRFRHTADNYTQIAPAAIMVGMKAAGVPSRSSWGRMLLSGTLSTAIMATVTQVSKNTTHVWRPDGSNQHSFPSGHTATAFMTATMLSKEYGHLSPWVSVGAYTMASATGLMRIANNKHWMSDVMVGAGVGILSTEFGYWIADAIMKRRGLNHAEAPEDTRTWSARPSFVALYSGFNLPLSHYDIGDGIDLKTSTGTTVGLEGAYFFNRHVGVGGRMSVSNLRIIVNKDKANDDTFDYYTTFAGPYFNLPLTARWSVGTKVLAGLIRYNKTDVDNKTIPANNGWGVSTGASINLRLRRNLSFDVHLDYNLQSPHSPSSGEYLHIMTLGALAAVRF